jgi:hypothetical protein
MGRPRNYERDSRSQQAQFEGDYERFDGYEERAEREEHEKDGAAGKRSTQPGTSRAMREEHPADREFRDEVEQETNSLMGHIQATSTPHEGQAEKRTAHAEKSRSKAASAISREKKQTRKGKTAVKVRSAGPKPSQRGFKWPTS